MSAANESKDTADIARALSKAQKRDLLRAYRSPEGVALGLAYGPMVALTQTYRLGHELFAPFTRGATFQITQRGKEVAAFIEGRQP